MCDGRAMDVPCEDSSEEDDDPLTPPEQEIFE